MVGIRTYVEEIVNELSNKVSWPTWEELQTSSVIVLVTSIILAQYCGYIGKTSNFLTFCF